MGFVTFERKGALLTPTVIADVARDADMWPLAPIMPVRDLDDAIQLANSTAYGLSAGVVTTDLNRALMRPLESSANASWKKM